MKFKMAVLRLLCVVVLVPSLAWAQASPTISIIIDDLGYRLAEGHQVIALPGPLAYAVIPFTPHGRSLAQKAHQAGKEVMLHAPMQSIQGEAASEGELMLDMQRHELEATLAASLKDIPHAIGVNNHQGSLLTRHPGHMAWLMAAVRQHGGLFFVDSRTSRLSVAEQVAKEHQVPVLRRDVFLDHQPNEAFIRGQYERLIERAKRKGYAIGIGHPYPETIKVLREQLPKLASRGVTLVPISAQIREHATIHPLLRLTENPNY